MTRTEQEMRFGVFGGTFDPIHIGHLIMAELAREMANLSRVMFVPAGQPWLKSDRAVSSAAQRVEMVRIATESNACFGVSTVDVERPGPSYTVDTIEALRSQWGQRSHLFVMLGVDAMLSLPEWKDPNRLVRECEFVVLPRCGVSRDELGRLEADIPAITDRLVWLPVPEIGISSTDIRDRVSRGLSVRYLVPEGVEAYIREQGLYRRRQGG